MSAARRIVFAAVLLLGVAACSRLEQDLAIPPSAAVSVASAPTAASTRVPGAAATGSIPRPAASPTESAGPGAVATGTACPPQASAPTGTLEPQATALRPLAPPATGPPAVGTPTPARVYGCPSSPCPRSLAYAVNGCTCADSVYTEESVSNTYCCAAGFSDEECPEALQGQALLEATFGATREDVESQLVDVELQGWTFPVHRKAEAALKRVAENLVGVDYEIREPVGSFNWREIAGRSVLSYHSFGIAVDINPTANPSCGVTAFCHCYNDLVTDMPPEFVKAFKDAGFDWGGDWKDHPDPMHFEWAGWRQ